MPGSTTGFKGLPRGPAQPDLRTRRVLQRLAGTKWLLGGAIQVENDGTINIFLAPNAEDILDVSDGLAFDNQSANRVFAGPSSGGAAAPTFRLLVPADVPLGIGSAVISGVPDQILYVEDDLTLQQADNVRYEGNWLLHINGGQPTASDMAEGEFAMSLKTAVP